MNNDTDHPTILNLVDGASMKLAHAKGLVNLAANSVLDNDLGKDGSVASALIIAAELIQAANDIVQRMHRLPLEGAAAPKDLGLLGDGVADTGVVN